GLPLGLTVRWPQVPIDTVTAGDPIAVGVLIREGRVAEAERLQHGVGQKFVEPRAGQTLDDLLEVGVALAGVSPVCPGRPPQEQRPVAAPVWKSGRVAEHY